jgi:2-oxoisovalerate dehydrogenase E1 component
MSKPANQTTLPDTQPQRVLDINGDVVGQLPHLTDDELLELFRNLVRTRTFNERCLHLQRTGRIPFYYPCSGQEAHVAIPLALEARDWIFVQYREQGVRLARGVTEKQELALWRGMPFDAWNPQDVRITPLDATIGTHLPHATGYAYGARLLERDEVSLAIFGDGATSEGDFHAGLNFAGVRMTPTVFYCQNNLYAQSTPLAEQTASETLAQKAVAYGIHGVRVDGMDVLAVYEAVHQAAERARSGDGPTLIEGLCYRYLAHSTYDGVPVYRTREEEAEYQERDPLIRMRAFLDGRGLLPADFEETVQRETRATIEQAADELEATTLTSRDQVFLATYDRLPVRLVEQLHHEQKMAGETVTEIPAERILQVPDDPEPGGDRQAMTMVEALNAALTDAMERRPNTVILGEDVAREGGVFRVTADLYERFGSERMFDTPLCENGIIGTGVGMALAGIRPVCEMEFAGFCFPGFDQMVTHVARFPWRTNRAFDMPMVIRMPAGGGHCGLEGHSETPEAYFTHTSGGLNVVYPSNPYDAKGLMAAALESSDPVIFFEPVAQYFVRQDDVPVEHYILPIGKAKVVREGTDVTLVTYGNLVHTAATAADTLAGEGVSVELIDLRTLRPWDEGTVLASVEKTGRLVVAHEAPLSGGFGAEVVATVAEKAGYLLETPPVRVAHADTVWAPALLEPLSLIEPARLVDAARRVMED